MNFEYPISNFYIEFLYRIFLLHYPVFDIKLQFYPPPDGAASCTSVLTGIPKSGVPSLRQVNCCMRGERRPSQPQPGLGLAWYSIQSCLPSGDLKNELCPVAYTLFASLWVKTGFGDFFHERGSSRSAEAGAVSIPSE